MNWYKHIKFAQIGITYTPKIFEDYLSALYELEYKYSAVKNYPFRGHPNRRENILNSLRNNLINIIEYVKRPILETFSSWLDSHALLSADRWARQRLGSEIEAETGWEVNEYTDVDESDIQELFETFIYEYITWNNPKRLFVNPRQLDPHFARSLNDILLDIEKFPAFKKLLEHGVKMHKRWLLDTLKEEGYEEFGESCGMEFTSNKEAKKFIQSLSSDEIGLDSLLETSGMNELDTFIHYAIETDLWLPVLHEMYANIIFPEWYKHWSKQGIDKTRETVQNIYNDLKNVDPNNIEDTIIKIDRAINASHQTGSMLEYLDEHTASYDLEATLNELRDRLDVDEWNNELRAIGVQI